MNKIEAFVLDAEEYYKIVEREFGKKVDEDYQNMIEDNQEIGTDCYVRIDASGYLMYDYLYEKHKDDDDPAEFECIEADFERSLIEDKKYGYPSLVLKYLVKKGILEKGTYFIYVSY